MEKIKEKLPAKEILLAMIGLSLGIIFLIAGSYSYFSDITSVTNYIQTGDVNIEMKEFELVNNQEVSYTNDKTVCPGESISKIPKIFNYGEDCYVRVKVTYADDKDQLVGFSDDNLIGMDPAWVKIGDYYYDQEILKKDENVTVFTGVTVPRDWSEEHEGQKLTIDLQADAIQSANYSPDFDSLSPWKNQVIEKCIHEQNSGKVSEKSKVELSVEFSGSAHKLLAFPDDFFENFDIMMPGDSKTDQALVKNTTEKEAEIFFHTGLVCKRPDRLELLDKLLLKIWMDEKLIYSGNLRSSSLETEEISLGKFAPGEGGILKFEVSMPADCTNEYALRDAVIKWYFTVYEDDEVSSKEEESQSQTEQKTNTQQTSSASASAGGSSLSRVRTGDDNPILLLTGLLAISGSLASLIIYYRRRRKEP